MRVATIIIALTLVGCNRPTAEEQQHTLLVNAVQRATRSNTATIKDVHVGKLDRNFLCGTAVDVNGAIQMPFASLKGDDRALVLGYRSDGGASLKGQADLGTIEAFCGKRDMNRHPRDELHLRTPRKQ